MTIGDPVPVSQACHEPYIFNHKYVSCVIVVIFVTTLCVDKIAPLFTSQTKLIQCFIDNGGHSIISAEIWLSGIYSRRSHEERLKIPEEKQSYDDRYWYMSDIRIKELVCAFLVGSLLDTDHFLAGLYVHHALSLQAATALPSRPGGHALLFVLIAMGFCYLLASLLLPVARRSYRCRLSLLVGSSLLSHQLRDATRRGLWLYPLHTVIPLSYTMYMASLAGLACTVHCLAMNVSIFSHHTMVPEKSLQQSSTEMDEVECGSIRKRHCYNQMQLV